METEVVKPKSMLRILRETVVFYGKTPSRRGIGEYGQCEYLTEDGKMCAVGRCMIDPSGEVGAASSVLRHKGDALIKPEYRGHSVDFWQDLQTFHDGEGHWVPTGGVSRVGKGFYGHIYGMIKEGRY